MLAFIQSFKECRLIILGKYHYFSELLDSIENASPEETADFWKMIAPLHYRLDTDEFNISEKVTRHQSFKNYVYYFKDFFMKCRNQIDLLLTVDPQATAFNDDMCKSLFIFYITISLYAEIGKFMMSESHNQAIAQMRALNEKRKKASTKTGLYNNSDKTLYLNELKSLMSHEGSLAKISDELLKVLIAANIIDVQFTRHISYHSTFVAQGGKKSPITQLHYNPKSLLKKLDKQINEFNRSFIQHLTVLSSEQRSDLNKQRNAFIKHFVEVKQQTLSLSQAPLWVKGNDTSLEILENYQSLLRASAELIALNNELRQMLTIIQTPTVKLPYVSPPVSPVTTTDMTTVSDSTPCTSSSSSSSYSCEDDIHSQAVKIQESSLDELSELSHELAECNRALAWDFARSKAKKLRVKPRSTSSSSSSSSAIQESKLERIAANLQKYKEQFKQLFTHKIHMTFTEKELQKIIMLAGGSIIDAEGSRKRIVIDQTASDTLQSKMVIHQQHGPKAKSRSTLPSFIVKNYRCVLQNAGLTPDKLWPHELTACATPITCSVRPR